MSETEPPSSGAAAAAVVGVGSRRLVLCGRLQGTAAAVAAVWLVRGLSLLGLRERDKIGVEVGVYVGVSFRAEVS